jgi:hypothetical protein
MKPIYRPDGSVQVRFIAITASEEDYEGYYKHVKTYWLYKKEGSPRHPTYVLITMISDNEDYIKRYLLRNPVYKCYTCNDRGVVSGEKGYSPCVCDFGKIIAKII